MHGQKVEKGKKHLLGTLFDGYYTDFVTHGKKHLLGTMFDGYYTDVVSLGRWLSQCQQEEVLGIITEINNMSPAPCSHKLNVLCA